MSTHVLGTAQEYCDRFVMINHGRLQASGTLAELRDTAKLKDGNLTDIYLAITQGGKNND